SMTRSTTCSCAAKVPAWRSIASTRVVLPWSTWEMIAMFRSSGTTDTLGVAVAAPSPSETGLRLAECRIERRDQHVRLVGPEDERGADLQDVAPQARRADQYAGVAHRVHHRVCPLRAFQLDPDEEPKPAHVDDRRMIAAQGLQTRANRLCDALRV